ncbi:MAG: carbohydrate kinase family protein, partial [Anaerolineae bacterium]|nr:carbohydrate kinase family protein [Anaerolineae bacterium]
AALGGGGAVGIAAAVGTDCTDALLAPLLRAGIDVSGLLRGAPATPRAWQRFSASGERSHLWQVAPPPGETVYQAALKALPSQYRMARAMHWGLHPENPTLALAQQFGAAGATISLETFRPPDRPLEAEALRDLVTACTVFSPSWGEASAMIGSADAASVVRGFRAAGCQVLVLRRAEQGADVWDFRSGGLVGLHVPAVPVEVVDTTGAGNAFAGAFLARLDDGIAAAAAHGAAAASFMLEQFGMPPSLPDPLDFARRAAWAQERQSRLTL